MASSLSSFLIKDTKVRRETTIPATLKDGTQVEMDIRELDGEELKRLRSRNTRTYPPAEGTSMSSTGLDEIGFAEDVVLTAVIDPDLRNAELFNHYGVTLADKLLYKMFKVAEITNIATQIIDFTNENPNNKPTTNGTEPELIRQAKNS